MADSNVDITAGTGTSIDTRTEATNGHHRQVVVLGDPATNAGVAPVDATAGLKVDLGADNDITGTVTANLSATDNAVLDQIELNTDPLLVVGGGLEATAQRVTIASDSTGVVSVDDNGGALTVDGTVTANLAAGTNNIGDVDILTIAAGDNNIGNVDVVTLPNVTLAAGTNTNEVVGDAADDAAAAGNPVLIGGTMKLFDGTDPGALSAENDAGSLTVDNNRRLYVNDIHPRFWHVSADYAAAQTNVSVKAAPGVSLCLYITDIQLSNGATAGNVTLLDGSGGTVLYEVYPAINGGAVLNLRSPIKLTANTALCLTSTTVTTHSIFVAGFIAP